MLNRILPLLDKVIPSSMAKKAIEKINPNLTQFFSNAAATGYGIEEALDFLRSQATPEYNTSMRTDEYAKIGELQQQEQFPDLLKKGASTALGATAISSIPTVLGNMFQDEEEQIPEQEQKRLEALGKFKQNVQKRKIMEEERDRFNDYYGQKHKPQEQVGPGEQALMQILQQINARLGK